VLVPAASFAALLLVNLCHRLPEGGLATGPRFLLPALPLLMLPIAAWLGQVEHAGRAWARRALLFVAIGLAGVGVTGMLAATAVGGRLAPRDPNPWANQVVPAWRDGQLTRSLGTWLTGEGSPAAAQMAPLVLYWLAVGFLLARRALSGGEEPRPMVVEGHQKSGGSHAKRD
jgi:hypothetical protein